MPKLTKKLIDDTAPPPTGQVFLRDTPLQGFALRVTAGGAKSFILEKRIQGRPRRFTLGPYGALTVEQARKLAQEKIGDIARGGDPALERQARRQSATFGALEQVYFERHAIHKRSAHNDRCLLNKWLSEWRPRRLTGITRADVSARHRAIGATGKTTTANRMIALVRTMFNLAKHQWELFDGENPASGIKFFKEVARDRFITISELPRLWHALQQEPNPFVRSAFVVGLLTGARRSEVLAMQWAHLDLPQALWRIPDTKAGRPHTIPLPPPVLEELSKLPRLEGNPYVFCGRRETTHLVNIAKAWTRIRQQAGLDDVRIHDLRRTLGSWLVGSGASLPLIGKVLNHADVSTTAIYSRLELDAVRTALTANATKMLSVIQQAEKDDASK